MPPRSAISLTHWLRSPLFRSYVRNFVLLWLLVKGVNALIARLIGLPPLGFRFGTETIACAIELLALRVFIRHEQGDILLGNLGLRPAVALAPLVLVHLALSLVAAAFA